MKDRNKVAQQAVRNESHKEYLRQWFTEQRWKKVFPILSNSDPDSISLRLLEFLTDASFAEACAKQGVSTCYYIENTDGSGRRFFDLPSQLLAAQNVRSKKLMDAFARRNKDLENGGRFRFGYPDSEVETNVAQLQFLRFLVENHVLEWVRKHRDLVFRVKSECKRRRSDEEEAEEEALPKRSRRSSASGPSTARLTGVHLNL